MSFTCMSGGQFDKSRLPRGKEKEKFDVQLSKNPYVCIIYSYIARIDIRNLGSVGGQGGTLL